MKQLAFSRNTSCLTLFSGCASWGYSRWTEENDVTCYINNDFTSPVYRDTRVNNPENRQWMWMLCNEPYAFILPCNLFITQCY